MTDKIPELTFETAAAAETIPTLTLTPEQAEVPEAPVVEEKKIDPVEMDEKLLSEEERKVVEEFSKKIDILLLAVNNNLTTCAVCKCVTTTYITIIIESLCNRAVGICT